MSCICQPVFLKWLNILSAIRWCCIEMMNVKCMIKIRFGSLRCWTVCLHTYTCTCTYMYARMLKLNPLPQEVGQLPGNISFHNLKAGDTVGLLYEDSGTLHFFLNGVHMVQLPCTVPKGVYGFVDIYGQCVKVILRPLIYWSGGSPRHVMNDDSALDMERDLSKRQQLCYCYCMEGILKATHHSMHIHVLGSMQLYFAVSLSDT